MSVSQAKKAVEELASYLGRDTAGLDKLRKVKESINLLRNKLAVSSETEALSRARSELAISEAQDLRAQLEAAKLEIHRLRQIVANAQRMAILEHSSKADAAQTGEPPQNRVCPQYKAAMKELRTHMRRCPITMTNKPRVSTTGLMFDRDSLASGWSHKSLWILGASVAALAAYGGEVTILSSESIGELEPFDDDSDKQAHQFLNWFSNNIDNTAEDSVWAAIRKTELDAKKTKGIAYKQ